MTVTRDMRSTLREQFARPTALIWMTIFGLLVVLLLGAWKGMFWTAVTTCLALLFVTLAWAFPRMGVRVATLGLAFVSFVLVTPALRPTEINYALYSSALMLTVGLLSLMRLRLRPPTLYTLFLVWVLVTGIFTIFRTGITPFYLPFVVPALMFGAFLMIACSDEDAREYFARTLLWLAVAQSLIGLSQSLFDTPTFQTASGSIRFEEPRNYLAFIIPGVSRWVRMATGTYEHFNGLGALLALATPVAFEQWRQTKRLRSLLLLVLVFAGLVATFSRGALLGALIGVASIYFLEMKDRSAGLRRILVALIVVLGLGGLWNTIAEYGNATQNVSGRVLTWTTAIDYALSDPLSLILGYGHSFFAYYLIVLRGIPDRLHSAPLQVALETGFAGVALLVSSVYSAVRRGLKSYGWLYIGATGGVIAFMVHQSVDNSLFAYNGAWFSGLLAIAATAPQLSDSAEVDSDE